jgi:chromosome segregation ATPase
MGCHQNMADTAFWTDSVIAKYGKITTNEEHIKMLNQMVHDAVAAGDSEAAAKYEDAIKQLEEAQATAEEAQNAAKEAEAKVQAAEMEKKNLEAELEKTKAQANVEQAPAPAEGGSNWVAILIAALIGLVVGGGVAFVLKK